MKTVRDTTGRFRMRPHYEPGELDRECERLVVDFLKHRYGEAKFPISTDDLTAMIEKEADDLDHYADLSDYGPAVEGVTIFQPGGKPTVKIAAALSEGNRENRRRTTLTHEFGHVKFHSYLFDPAIHSLDLFGDPVEERTSDRVQVCKRDTMLDAGASDWMEWQAGYVCGAILMPASVLRHVIKEKFAQEVAAGLAIIGLVAAAMIEEGQGRFQVSAEAARVRLLRLEVIRDAVNKPALF